MVNMEKSVDCKSIPHRLMINMEKGQNKYGKLMEPEERDASASKKKDLEVEEVMAFERKLVKYLKYFFAIALIVITMTMGYLLLSNYHAKTSVFVESAPTSDMLKNILEPETIPQPEEDASHGETPFVNSRLFFSDAFDPFSFSNRFDKDYDGSQIQFKITIVRDEITGPLATENGSGQTEVQNSISDDDTRKMSDGIFRSIIFSLRPMENAIDDARFASIPDDMPDFASFEFNPPKVEKEETLD